MKKINILQKVSEFINVHYPGVSGVLLFGSASFTKDYQDIDLLIVDEKFSYTSKADIHYNGNHFSIIKISNFDIFNILAEDYKKGVYKNIFETGFIIKDEIKLLTFTKQFICEDYPDENQAVAHCINKCVLKINEAVKSFERKLPLTEEFLVFGNLVSFLIDFIILRDGKINFATSKHKSRYLHQYHCDDGIIINNIINDYRKKGNGVLVKVKEFIERLNVPQVHSFYNDYLMDNIDQQTSLVIYLPGAVDEGFYSRFIISLQEIKATFYTYWIDSNNMEEPGLYFIIKNERENFFFTIKSLLKDLLKDQIFFFPYNMAFCKEIKFGGDRCCKVAEELFFDIQNAFESIEKNEEKYNQLILLILHNMDVSFEEIEIYYFYKTINNSHHLSINDIIEKEKLNTMKTNHEPENKPINIGKIRADLNFEVPSFTHIPKYFQIQIFDRILSMLFLKDTEKGPFITLLRDQGTSDV